ncbi:MAG: P-loop NTPase [Candidatus Micrarchaeia archaeon]
MADSYNPEDIAKSKSASIHPSFFTVVDQRQEVKAKLSSIKHKIGIYSAKGGVGKTTIAVNVAYALSGMGYKVGLLDADIDCPNVTFFLGMENAKINSYPMIPLERNGVKVLSTAMLTDSRGPIIWRGPLIAKMTGDFLRNTEWGELDYLIIDLPPGTSDAPLSIMQLLDLTGFVIVTTPQHIASLNAIRSGIMVKKFNISLLGVIENMSDGSGDGAKEVSEALNCRVLGIIKNSAKFSMLSDMGKIPVVEDAEVKEEFAGIVKNIIE